MKYVKMLGLLTVAVVALMAFSAAASATILTSKGVPLENGEAIHAVNEKSVTLDGPAAITCEESTVEGKITQSGGVNSTVKGKVEKLTFAKCNQHVTVEAMGELIAHTEYTKEAGGHETEKTTSTNNGTLTSNGAKVKVVITSLGLTCVYATNETDIGTVTGSKSTGGKATLDIDSSPIPRTEGSFFCGTSAEWTGNYIVEVPGDLNID